jgi:putative transposase
LGHYSRTFRKLKGIDEGNREALQIEVGTSISAIRLQWVMNELIEVYGKPQAIRLDNGPEMTAQSFVDWAERLNISIRFIKPEKPNQKAFIERLNKSYQQKVLDIISSKR